MKKTTFILLTLSLVKSIYAQEKLKDHSQIGKPCPDITFSDVHYFDRNTVKISDFKGKWLILDCWNKYCGGCISTFPTTDSLQKEFSSKVNFLLVGYTGSQYFPDNGSDEKSIKSLFDNIRKKENLNLAIAYDSIFFKRFDVGGCPFLVVIDPKGIIKYITYKVTRDNIRQLIAGKRPDIPTTYTKSEETIIYNVSTAIDEDNLKMNKETILKIKKDIAAKLITSYRNNLIK